MSDYTINQVVKLVPALSDWYWQYGHQRKNTYALSRSTWLDRMLMLGKEAHNIFESETTYANPTMAIWGPSQTGKSTLLADYIDGDSDKFGNGSALQWHADDPVRFVGDICGGEVTVLNPFNKGADASGCVTRFVMRDCVDFPEYPVKVTLATEAQIIHGLAVGYLSETIAQDTSDQVVHLTPEMVKKWVEDVDVKGPVCRDAFQYMVEVSNIIDLLIMSNIPRYQNLKKEWGKSLRRELLDSPGLISNIESARAFTGKLFWDSWTSLSKTYSQLINKLNELEAQFGTAPVHMSYKFAAQVLNISAVELAESAPIVNSIINSAGYEMSGGAVMIGEKPSRKLFSKLDEFALFQGLVWEIEVPLKSEILRKNSKDAADLLESVELLDFPGVANEHKAAGDALLTDEALLSDGRRILTKVLKRGKTASIVVTSSRNLNIDGFSLLMRMNNYPSNPEQLNSGIRSWWESYDKEWPPQSKDLPLNLVLTFTAQIVNLVADSGVGHGLDESFKKMNGLSYLADPKYVNTFATNYPQFSDGKLQVEGEKLSNVVSSIIEDNAFQRQFGDNAESLKEMSLSGGREYFIRALLEQARTSTRPSLVRAKEKRVLADFQRLIAEASPDHGDASAKRHRDLDGVISSIVDSLKAGGDYDAGSNVGRVVQSLVNIDAEVLEDLPKRASKGAKAAAVKEFLSKQFTGWRESQAQKMFDQGVGLDDPAKVSRILSYMIDSVDLNSLQKWFRSELGNIKSSNDASESRRFLAAKMNKEILSVNGDGVQRVHHELRDVDALIRQLAEAEYDGGQYDTSPYYKSVIEPFLSKLEFLKSSKGGDRGMQPGDEELLTTLKSVS